METNKELLKAIEERRYRDAQAILESGDIDLETADKWLRWLAELHRAEWEQAGIESEKKAAEIPKSEGRALFGGIIAVQVAVLLTAYLSVLAFTTTEMFLQVSIATTAVVVGATGWQRAAGLMFTDHSREIGVFIWFVLTAFLASAWMPVWYSAEPQYQFSVVTFLLLLPVVTEISWWIGKMIGRTLGRDGHENATRSAGKEKTG